jgi:hypothetical protein
MIPIRSIAGHVYPDALGILVLLPVLTHSCSCTTHRPCLLSPVSGKVSRADPAENLVFDDLRGVRPEVFDYVQNISSIIANLPGSTISS